MLIDRSAATTDKRGRPRRFDEGTERKMIMDAAIRLMERNSDAELSAVDILAETGLSSRSFYRHFDSKEALLVALVRREAELVARSMERAIASAAGPVAAVEAWLERLLDTFFEPRRAARSAIFTTPAASGAAEPSASSPSRAPPRARVRPLHLRWAHPNPGQGVGPAKVISVYRYTFGGRIPIRVRASGQRRSSPSRITMTSPRSGGRKVSGSKIS